MLRSVLVGILAVTSAAACKDKDGAPAQASAAAGKVVEVSGVVNVHGKPLAVGDRVAADDEVETGADGRVVIELAHNAARWELGPNKKEKVSASIAWNLPKNQGNAKAVDQDTSAAGRPAERNAAETTATAAPAASAAPAPAPAAGGPGGPPPTAQPAPPPPPPKPARAAEMEEKEELVRGDVGAAAGGGGDDKKKEMTSRRKSAPAPVALAQAPDVQSLVVAHRAELVKCYGGPFKLTVHVAADGTPSAPMVGSTKAHDCIVRVLKAIKFPAAETEVKLDLK